MAHEHDVSSLSAGGGGWLDNARGDAPLVKPLGDELAEDTASLIPSTGYFWWEVGGGICARPMARPLGACVVAVPVGIESVVMLRSPTASARDAPCMTWVGGS
jgi:hypothetical protein